MEVFRICRKARASDPLSGEGAFRFGGRWNSRGTRLVYASGSRALAALETMVHADVDLLGGEFVLVEIEVPDRLAVDAVERRMLPRGWRTYPSPPALRERGDAWARSGSTAILSVPSVLIPEEPNFLLNPAHAGAPRLVVRAATPFKFDPRPTRHPWEPRCWSY